MCAVCKKKTFLVPSGKDKHLFIVITDICKKKHHMLAPVCSIRPGRYYDDTCVIGTEESAHPFIKHDSYVSYKDIQVRNVNVIDRCVESSSFIEKEDIDDVLFERICEGINKSLHIPRWAKKQFNDWPQ